MHVAPKEAHPLLQKIAPKVTSGLLGKKVNLLSAGSAAKPNQAVQGIQTFINQNKIILMTGSTSSAVAVALNKFAQREKVLYVTASPAPTTLPARIVCAMDSGRTSTARRRLMPLVRFWSSSSARIAKRRS
jgi:hypothetical protein